MNYYIFIFFIILLFFTSCYGVEIKLLTPVVDNSNLYDNIENEFSEYAAKKKLNITIKLDEILYDKPSDSFSYFKSLVESLLKNNKNESPYDIYFFNSKYTSIYGPYLLNLSSNIPKEIIETFNPNVLREECTYNDELVALPLGMTYEILYSNKNLLTRYDKAIPKTWNELIDTCKYIMEKEKDHELICYNGLFEDSELGLYSLYEFIYSCRDSYNSTYPNIQDQSFINALNALKNLKNEIASNEIFKSNENFTFGKLINGKAIFIKYFLVLEPLLSRLPYYQSILPGLKEGISGSLGIGDNIGIVKSLKGERKKATIEVVKFFASKEHQRETFLNKMYPTTITEILDDEEVCKKARCDLLKDVQFTGEPKFIKEASVDYRNKYKKYIYQFLYENKTKEETLKQITDITKIYYISLDTKNSYVGLIFFILIFIVSILMLLSLILLFNDKFHQIFIFLPTDFWIITVIGSILILWIPLFNYGQITTLKCHLKPFLSSIGYTFSLCPVTHKLISQFPKNTKISIWVNNHKYMFLLINILTDIIFNIISLIDQYTPKKILAENGENFEICEYNGKFSIFILIIYKFIVAILMLFLIFVEWNISSTKHNLRLIVTVLYIDILSFAVILFVYIVNIKYYLYFFLSQIINTMIISISNFIFLYSGRIFLKIKTEGLKIEEISKNHFNFVISDSGSQTKYSNNMDNSKTIIKSDSDII